MNRIKSLIKILTVIYFALPEKTLAENFVKNRLEPIVVTANPLLSAKDQIISPVTIVQGDNLNQKLQPTIGETLSSEPGIRSTYFGPNSSRPVIRGLEGDQINIMQNGINNLDASSVSVDHNVAIDPLSVKKIEIIRGPSALLYGSKAVGGVVNIIDNRIPDKPINEKVTAITDARYNSANKERSASALFEGGASNYAYHLNGFKRISDNISIPSYGRSISLRESDPLSQESKNKLTNSQSNSQGSTIGLSRFFKKGYFGASLNTYNSNYGTVAEPDVTIDMKQQRIDFAGSYQEPVTSIKKVNFKLGISDYKHTEFEGLQAGTIFENRGFSSRAEIIHDKFGIFEGLIGFQSDQNKFSTIGDEAFLLPTTTNINSAFILEEIAFDKAKLQAGARLDHQKIEINQSSNMLKSGSRSDLNSSASLGLIKDFLKNYTTKLSLNHTQRAPNAQELYADGVHVATDSFELGNQNLKAQKSYGVDISLLKKSNKLSGEINLFYNRFQDFITLSKTSNIDLDSNLPIYNYTNLSAEFFGAEFKTNIQALEIKSHKLGFEIRGDYVEARNKKDGSPLPRISPARIGASLIYDYQKFGFKLDSDYSFAVNHVAPNETKTKDYLMINAYAGYDLNFSYSDLKIYLKATNILNQEARNHVSLLKDKAPLASRSIMIGLKSFF